MKTPTFILASGSPRRRELLARILGAEGFLTVPTDFDESSLRKIGSSPEVTAVAYADGKRDAWTAGNRSFPGEVLVLSADTVVFLDGQMLGKPKDARDAKRMLQFLSGRRHHVITGLSLGVAREGRTIHVLTHAEVTDVVFAPLSDALVDWYVSTGEPMDKAGAYGIQGHGALLVERIEGCYYNVMGLPLRRLFEMIVEIAGIAGLPGIVSHRSPTGEDLFGVLGKAGTDGDEASDYGKSSGDGTPL